MVIVVLSLINCLWKNLHLIPIFINFDVPEDILLLILSRRTKEAGTDIRKRFGINIGCHVIIVARKCVRNVSLLRQIIKRCCIDWAITAVQNYFFVLLLFFKSK
jgi:hypothetical protein